MESEFLCLLASVSIVEVDDRVASFVCPTFRDSQQGLVGGEHQRRQLRSGLNYDSLLPRLSVFKNELVVERVGRPASLRVPHQVIVDPSEAVVAIHDVRLYVFLSTLSFYLLVHLLFKLDVKLLATVRIVIVAEPSFFSIF